MYKHITLNTIYYYSHTFSLMIYTLSVMYMGLGVSLYHNPIYCWALSIQNYFNFIPMPLCHSHTLLSYKYDKVQHVVIYMVVFQWCVCGGACLVFKLGWTCLLCQCARSCDIVSGMCHVVSRLYHMTILWYAFFKKPYIPHHWDYFHTHHSHTKQLLIYNFD